MGGGDSSACSVMSCCQLRMVLAHLNQRAAASDLNVIAVRAQAEDYTVGGQIGLKSQHHLRPRPVDESC